MRTWRLVGCGVLAAWSLLANLESAHAIKVLMHGREAAATFRDDPFVFQHLQDKYGTANVSYMPGSAAATDGSSAIGYDVVFISSTMASGDTRNKYEDSHVGIVFGENALVHDNNIGNFFLADAGGNQDATPSTLGRNTIHITDPTHPLAAGLSGDVTVFNTTPTDTYWWQFARGQLAPGVHQVAESMLDVGPAGVSGDYSNNSVADAADYVVFRHNVGSGSPLTNDNGMASPVGSAHYDLWRARFGDSSAANDGFQHAIIAADSGNPIWGNGAVGSPTTAAGRRVFFFLSDFGFFDLTDDGVKLFDAAIDWAAVHPAGSGMSASSAPEPVGGALVAIALSAGVMVRRRWSRR